LLFLHQEEASRFPALTGKSLNGSPFSVPTNQISLVLISLRGIGMVSHTIMLYNIFINAFFNFQRMLDQYRVPFEAEFKGGVAVYELSLVDKLFYRIMTSWIQRNLKKTVPPERQVILLQIT
jgi:hypothetical protein